MYRALVNFCQIATRQKRSLKSHHWLRVLHFSLVATDLCSSRIEGFCVCVWCFLHRFFSDFHDIQELFLKMSNAFSWSKNMESQPRTNVCVKVHMYPASCKLVMQSPNTCTSFWFNAQKLRNYHETLLSVNIWVFLI